MAVAFKLRKPPSSIPLIDIGDSLSRGQVGWWLANEGAGTRLTNIANPNVFNGTLQSGATWANTLHGKSLSFDGGANSYVNLGTSPLIASTTTPFTLSWIENVASSPPTFAALMCLFAGGASQRWLMFHEDSNVQYLRLAIGLGSVSQVRAFKLVPTLASGVGLSRHWLMTVPDGMAGTAKGVSAGSPTVWVDGIAFTTTVDATGALSSQTGNLNYLGWDGADSKWKGNLEMRLWNRVLDTHEINRLITNPFAGAAKTFGFPSLPGSAGGAPAAGLHRMFAAM